MTLTATRPEAVVAIIRRGDRVFLQRRALDEPRFPGLWELPGGKLEPGESRIQGLFRELREELDWQPESAEILEPVTHAYPDLRIRLVPFRCAGQGEPATGLAWAWFSPGEVARLPMPDGTRRILERELGA